MRPDLRCGGSPTRPLGRGSFLPVLYAGSFARPSLVVRLQQKGVNRVKLWTSFAAGDARQCLGVPEWFTLVERCATLGCRLARSAGGYGQPAGNQGAACNTLKRRDFWQPGGTGGLILSYEKKEGMGAGEVEKVESGGKSRPCCPCCQKPKEINGAGWHGRAACGRYRGGRASAWQGGADRHRHGHGQYGVALHPVGCEAAPGASHPPGRALVAVLISLAG